MESKKASQKLIVSDNKAKSDKKKYLVVLTGSQFVIYVDDDGNNVRIFGDYNVKAGDYLEL